MPPSRQNGFSLLELLVSTAIMGVMMAAVVRFFLVQNRTNAQQDLVVAREENLRVATDMVTDALRNTGSGAPGTSSLLPSWIPWVSSFTSNPKIISGVAASDPDSISMAACFLPPVATLSAVTASGATTLSLSTTAALDTNQRKLIRVGDSEFALVRSVGTGSITIDTNPTASGDQGLDRGYAAGTPICRVDVVTFSVQTDSTTGVPRLLRNENQGAGPLVAAEGITNLKITLLGSRRYQATVTARTERRDPRTGTFPIDQISTVVTLRN